MRPGRKPAGPKLIEGLSGSGFAKKRLELILRTLSGELTIEDACNVLNIGRTRFYDIRESLLEEMVDRLEPRPAGRPPQNLVKSEEVERLERKVKRLEIELEATQVRAELNLFLPVYRPKKTKPRK